MLSLGALGVSTEEQQLGHEFQREALNAWALGRGHSLEVFADIGLSGALPWLRGRGYSPPSRRRSARPPETRPAFGF